MLNNLINVGLSWQGILDDYFDEVKGLQDKEKCPQFLTNIITTYLNGAAKTIEELTTNL